MSDTPRTDAFVTQLAPFRLSAHDFTSPSAEMHVVHQLRELMIAWGAFARELERDLMNSTPKEWKP